MTSEEKCGGVTGGGMWGEEQAWLMRRLVCNLWILSEKKVANDWESKLSDSDEDKTWGKVRCRSLFTVFQSWRGLVTWDEMRDILKFLLAFMTAAWQWLVADRRSLRSSEEWDLDQARSKRRLADLSLLRAGVNHGWDGLERMLLDMRGACLSRRFFNVWSCSSQWEQID